MDHFPLMARFNRWVNDRFYECVAQLDEADYRADRGAFFGSVHHTLNHLLLVDRLWTRRIRRVAHGIPSLDHILFDDFVSLRAARQQEDEALVDLVDGMTPEQLDAPVTYRRMIGDGEEEARVGHILTTLFNHQTHHRGQIHCLLTQAGIEPPALDVIFFLEEIGQAGPPGTLPRRD